ncbi:hypothetical protein Bbelb_221630 [Branchiostoma belcheri]|nr:hypothetical protein Bbelb_221630 [Branchiostoma belcheri]
MSGPVENHVEVKNGSAGGHAAAFIHLACTSVVVELTLGAREREKVVVCCFSNTKITRKPFQLENGVSGPVESHVEVKNGSAGGHAAVCMHLACTSVVVELTLGAREREKVVVCCFSNTKITRKPFQLENGVSGPVENHVEVKNGSAGGHAAVRKHPALTPSVVRAVPTFLHGSCF